MSKTGVTFNRPRNSAETYLQNCYYIPFDITLKTDQIDNLKASGTKETDELITNLQKEISVLRERFAEAKRLIQNCTNNELYTRLLELRYINGLSTKSIASRVNVCRDYVSRCLGRALRAFDEYCVENKIKLIP